MTRLRYGQSEALIYEITPSNLINLLQQAKALPDIGALN
jgi:hypothetical protein